MSATSLHIPLQTAVRKKFTAKAKRLGFDSAQAYLRVLIQANVDNRMIDFDADTWGSPSPQAVARLNKATEEALADSSAGKLPSFTNAANMMGYLDRETH